MTPRGWYYAWGNLRNWISINPSLGLVFASIGTQSGGFSPDQRAAFEAELQRTAIPTIWDGLGDGGWKEINPATGKMRWLTVDGIVPIIYPNTAVTILANTVTVDNFFEFGSLDIIEQGGLHVTKDARVRSSDRIKLEQGASLIVDGTLSGADIVARDKSRVEIHGDTQFEKISIFDSQVTMYDDPDSRLRVANTLRLGGDSRLRFSIRDDTWNSTVVFESPTLKPVWQGDLEIHLTTEMDPTHLTGKSLQFFDWNPSAPLGEFDRLLGPAQLELDYSELCTAGIVKVLSVLSEPLMPGDFNADNQLDAADIDILSAHGRDQSPNTYYDLDGDGVVGMSDRSVLLGDLMGVVLGDTNLDGQVNFEDFLNLSTDFGGSGGWLKGDSDGSGMIDFADFLLLSNNYGVTSKVAIVPEPSHHFVAVLACCCLIGWRLRCRERQSTVSRDAAESLHVFDFP